MRSEIADGLKALALLGVFMVNGLGYALAPHYPMQLGAPSPVDSSIAQAIHALMLTLFMGKALPFLAFLFGYSMTHFSKRSTDASRLRHRQYKLLFVGILHGAFIYFGDILTSYALIGLWLSGAFLWRGRQLVRQLQGWLLLTVVLLLYRLFLEWQSFQTVVDQDANTGLVTVASSSTYSTFFSINAAAYFSYLQGWLLSYYAPLHIALFIAGVLAARYQWLSLKPRATKLFLRPWLYQSWPLALLANLLLGCASSLLHHHHGLAANIYWITVLNVPLGLWLVASSLGGFMRHIQTQQYTPNWLVWLAPAGRHTLAMYIGLSFVLMLCGRFELFSAEAKLSHTGIGAVALLALWLAAVGLGRAATARRWRDPISSWLSRDVNQ